MAHALSETPARILILERGDFVAAGRPRTGARKPSGSTCAIGRPRRWLDESGQEFRPYTHYCVGGNTKFWGSVLYRLRREDFRRSSISTASRRPGRSTTTRSSRSTIGPSACTTCTGTGSASIRRRPRADRFRTHRSPHAPAMADIVERLRQQGLHPSPLPLGLIGPGAGGCVLCSTCNSFPCKIHAKSDAEVCGVRPAHRTTERDAVDQRPRAAADHRSRPGGKVEAVEVEQHGETRARGGATRGRVSCGAVNSAALLLRSANDAHPDGLANSSGLVGRRYMAHLATMMQGFHPFRRNDTVFQKTVAINDFYLRGPDTDYPLGQIQSQGRTHGVMAQTVVPVDSALGVRRVGRARRRLAGDVGGSAARSTTASRSNPMGGSGFSYRRTTSRRTSGWSRETKAILCRLGFWMVMTHSHKARNTTHQCGTLVLRDRSARVGARSVLPHARRREPVRRRRVVLSVVGGRESGPDDRGAGAAGRGSHH